MQNIKICHWSKRLIPVLKKSSKADFESMKDAENDIDKDKPVFLHKELKIIKLKIIKQCSVRSQIPEVTLQNSFSKNPKPLNSIQMKNSISEAKFL